MKAKKYVCLYVCETGRRLKNLEQVRINKFTIMTHTHALNELKLWQLTQ